MLYSRFYGLKREPFSLSPDPSFMYLTPRHREALSQMRYAVEARRGFAVLTGEVGTGKTTLLRSLLEGIGPSVVTAYVVNPPRSRGELYAILASEFGLMLNGSDTWLLRIHTFLIEQTKARKTVVALFDEAQNIPAEVLEEIRLLTNLETADAKLLQVIFAGQPELDTIIDSDRLRALRQRIALRHTLGPLNRNETVEYIANRLRVAGARRMPFDRAACNAIYEYSNGIPRLINSLCETSLIAGFVAEQETINSRVVDEVASEAHLITRKKGLHRIGLRIVSAVAIVGVAVAVIATGLTASSVVSSVKGLMLSIWSEAAALIETVKTLIG